jgi:hypothetical protein
MSIYSQPQPNGHVASNGLKLPPNRDESLRLLSITESSDNELDVKNRPNASVPDLKLAMPSSGANRALSAAGKIRRKIRLKRSV